MNELTSPTYIIILIIIYILIMITCIIYIIRLQGNEMFTSSYNKPIIITLIIMFSIIGIIAIVSNDKYNMLIKSSNIDPNDKLFGIIPRNTNFICTGGSLFENYIYYRYKGNNKVEYYINENIAKSWDPNIKNAISINCADVNIPSDLTFTEILDKQLSHNVIFKCKDNPIVNTNLQILPHNIYYKYNTNKLVSYYESTAAASSYHSNLSQITKKIDCQGLSLDSSTPAIKFKYAENDILQCLSGLPSTHLASIHKYEGNHIIKEFPSINAVKDSWNVTTDRIKKIEKCNGLQVSNDMVHYKTLSRNEIVKCANNSDPFPFVNDGKNIYSFNSSDKNMLEWVRQKTGQYYLSPNINEIDCSGFNKEHSRRNINIQEIEANPLKPFRCIYGNTAISSSKCYARPKPTDAGGSFVAGTVSPSVPSITTPCDPTTIDVDCSGLTLS